MLFALLLAVDPPNPEGPPLWFQVVPYILMALLVYMLFIRMPQRQEQQRRSLIAALKKNDKIVNSGGIIGIVDSIKEKEDEVVLKGGIRITKSSVVRVLGPDESVKEAEK